MAKPQQPELRRSGTVPALDPDAVASDIEARRKPSARGEAGPVPEENLPGHHPPKDQDKPSGDRFLAKVRGRIAEDQGDGAEVEAADRSHEQPPLTADAHPGGRERSTVVRAGMLAAGALGAAFGVVRAVRKRTPLG